MVNLAILDPGHYFAQGSYGFSEKGLRLPFEGSFSVEVFPSHALLEGKAQQHSGRPIYPFRVQVSSNAHSQSQADVSVTIAGLPELKGRIALSGPTRELLASDPALLNQLSARVVPLEKPRIYEMSGILGLGGKAWFPFHFRVGPTDAQVGAENVVALPKRSA